MERKEVLNRAVVAAKEKDYVTARKILQGLLKQNSQDVDALLLFALVANKKEHAVQALKKILKIDPSHKIAREKLAQLEPSTSIPATPKPQLAPPIAQSFSDLLKKKKSAKSKKKRERIRREGDGLSLF